MTNQTFFAKDYMTTDLICFPLDMNIMEAISILIDNEISGAPVVDASGNLAGIITERDCIVVAVQVGYFEDFARSVKHFMVRNVETVQVEDNLLDIAQKLMQSSFRRFPVIDDEKLVGLITRRDILRAISQRTERIFR